MVWNKASVFLCCGSNLLSWKTTACALELVWKWIFLDRSNLWFKHCITLSHSTIYFHFPHWIPPFASSAKRAPQSPSASGLLSPRDRSGRRNNRRGSYCKNLPGGGFKEAYCSGSFLWGGFSCPFCRGEWLAGFRERAVGFAVRVAGFLGPPPQRDAAGLPGGRSWAVCTSRCWQLGSVKLNNSALGAGIMWSFYIIPWSKRSRGY